MNRRLTFRGGLLTLSQWATICFSVPCIYLATQNAFAQSAVDKLKQAIKGEGVVAADETTENAPAQAKAPSLMLSGNEREWIARAVKSYETKIPVSVLLPQLFPSEAFGRADTRNIPPPLPIDEPNAPQLAKEQVERFVPLRSAPNVPPPITFNSFIKLEDLGKRVWINGEKVDKPEEYVNGDVTAVDMRGNRMYFLWKDSRADMFYPEWKSAMAQIGTTDFYTNGKNVIIDAATHDLGFFIKPGETFDGQTLTVTEGKPDQNALAAAAKKTKAPAKTTEDEDDDDDGSTSFSFASDAEAEENIEDIMARERTKRMPKHLKAQDRQDLVRLYYLMTREEAEK